MNNIPHLNREVLFLHLTLTISIVEYNGRKSSYLHFLPFFGAGALPFPFELSLFDAFGTVTFLAFNKRDKNKIIIVDHFK